MPPCILPSHYEVDFVSFGAMNVLRNFCIVLDMTETFAKLALCDVELNVFIVVVFC